VSDAACCCALKQRVNQRPMSRKMKYCTNAFDKLVLVSLRKFGPCGTTMQTMWRWV
jgi:hypothetical protein